MGSGFLALLLILVAIANCDIDGNPRSLQGLNKLALDFVPPESVLGAGAILPRSQPLKFRLHRRARSTSSNHRPVRTTTRTVRRTTSTILRNTQKSSTSVSKGAVFSRTSSVSMRPSLSTGRATTTPTNVRSSKPSKSPLSSVTSKASSSRTIQTTSGKTTRTSTTTRTSPTSTTIVATIKTSSATRTVTVTTTISQLLTSTLTSTTTITVIERTPTPSPSASACPVISIAANLCPAYDIKSVATAYDFQCYGVLCKTALMGTVLTANSTVTTSLRACIGHCSVYNAAKPFGCLGVSYYSGNTNNPNCLLFGKITRQFTSGVEVDSVRLIYKGYPRIQAGEYDG